VLSSGNLEIELEGNLATQSSTYKEYRKGLRTQPCGAPLLRMIVEEVLLPVFIYCCLRVRKFRVKLQRQEPNPRTRTFDMRFGGIMVLKAEL